MSTFECVWDKSGSLVW